MAPTVSETTAEMMTEIRAAAEAFVALHPDAESARNALYDWLIEHDELMTATMDQLVWVACGELTYARRHQDRIDMKAGVDRSVGKSTLDHSAAGEIIGKCNAMYAWRMNSGMLLGDATAADLLAQAEQDENTGKGFLRNATFYASVASKCKQGRTVRQSMSEKVVRSLLDSAGK